MQRDRHTYTQKNSKPGTIAFPNPKGKKQVTNPNKTAIYDLFDQEFKIPALRKCSDLQDNTKKQFRNLLEKFTKGIF